MAKRQTTWAALPVAALVLCTTDAIAEQGATLLSDDRSLQVISNLSQCPDVVIQHVLHTPDPFALFSDSIDANQNCDVAVAIAIASQNSEVSPTQMSATGQVIGEAAGGVPGIIHAIPRSTFEVTFELAEPHEMALEAALTAFGAQQPPSLAAYADVHLWQPGGATIFEHHHPVGSAPGGGATIEIAEVLSLEPGVYTIRSRANIIIDGTVPPSAFNLAAYSLEVQLTPQEPGIPGDLTGDREVGVDDLLILLAEWGSCADCGDCPADLTGDCAVGVDDLLILLANWTG